MRRCRQRTHRAAIVHNTMVHAGSGRSIACTTAVFGAEATSHSAGAGCEVRLPKVRKALQRVRSPSPPHAKGQTARLALNLNTHAPVRARCHQPVHAARRLNSQYSALFGMHSQSVHHRCYSGLVKCTCGVTMSLSLPSASTASAPTHQPPNAEGSFRGSSRPSEPAPAAAPPPNVGPRPALNEAAKKAEAEKAAALKEAAQKAEAEKAAKAAAAQKAAEEALKKAELEQAALKVAEEAAKQVEAAKQAALKVAAKKAEEEKAKQAKVEATAKAAEVHLRREAARGSCIACTSGDLQALAKLASIFPAHAPAAIAEALGKAGGDTGLAAQALLSAALGQAKARLGFDWAHIVLSSLQHSSPQLHDYRIE